LRAYANLAGCTLENFINDNLDDRHWSSLAIPRPHLGFNEGACKSKRGIPNLARSGSFDRWRRFPVANLYLAEMTISGSIGVQSYLFPVIQQHAIEYLTSRRRSFHMTDQIINYETPREPILISVGCYCE